MAITRSKTGALPTPAPAATQKPTKRKNTSASKAASKVAKTEDKPELAEAKAAAEAAAEKKAETTGAAEEAETKNGGVSEAPSATVEQPSTFALEAVKEPAPETAPLPDVTTVLEKPAAAEVVTVEASAPTTAVEPTATVEPVAEAADATSAPPAPTAPSAATIPAPVTQEAPTKQEPVVAPTEEPSAHTSSTITSAPADSIKPFDVVVSDIEGTTTPISFVKDNLVSGMAASNMTLGNTDINFGDFPLMDAPAPAPNVHSFATFTGIDLTSSQPIVGIAKEGTGQPHGDNNVGMTSTTVDHALPSRQPHQQQHPASATVTTSL
ncbi:hypothetical protein BGW42_001550 [Actinomortierella wolfii]|nr:hypothetical protein BGW42_001550 [Actinomortierella wolfii]